MESLQEAGRIAVKLLVALLLALPLGWERERAARSPGLRTFPLVAMGACAYLMLGQRAFAGSAEAQARVLQGLLTGIGFIGGGAILKGHRDVHGVAAAASIWNTGAAGAAVALGSYLLAITLTVLTAFVLHFLPRISLPEPDEDHRREPR